MSEKTPYARVKIQEMDELQLEANTYMDNANVFGLLSMLFYVTALGMVFFNRYPTAVVAGIGGLILFIISTRNMRKFRETMAEMDKVATDLLQHQSDILMNTLRESRNAEARREVSDRARTISVVRGRRAGNGSKSAGNKSNPKSK